MTTSLAEWLDMTAQERLSVATHLVAALPDAEVTLRDGVPHVHLGQRVFVLVPGGDAQLGQDVAALPASPNWRTLREALGRPHLVEAVLGGDSPRVIPDGFHEWLAGQLTPMRTATLAPILLEVAPQPVVWEHVLPERDDEEDGPSPLAWPGHLEAWLTQRGMRLPTSDEWEHACAAGDRMLFRWGSLWPTDTTPYDVRHDTTHVASSPNRLGLAFDPDPYYPELVGGLELRGGDGGELYCGAVPAFGQWVTQMSAFRIRLEEVEYLYEHLEQVTYRAAISLQVYERGRFPKQTHS